MRHGIAFGTTSMGTPDKKIKLMLIIDALYGIKAGTETQLSLLIAGLDRNTYDISLICLRSTEWIEENSSALNCKLRVFNIRRMTDISSVRSFISLVGHLKEISPDIVMTFFRDSNIIGVIAARLAGIHVIISTRRDYGLWLDKKSYYFLRFANLFAQGMIANSRKVMELVCDEEKFDRAKAHVIYNGIKFKNTDPGCFDKKRLKQELGIPCDSPVVGIVANLRPMKRYPVFIHAAAHVLKEKPDTHFVIVGDGRLRGELENMAVELGIASQIHFAGSQEDVLPYIAIFDIGVNCSANEGLSNAIMEYMDFGIPCIVSAAGGNEELIRHGENGYTFELDNHMELAKRIINLMDDEAAKADFTKKSKEFVDNVLSVDRMIMAYDTYFDNMLFAKSSEAK